MFKTPTILMVLLLTSVSAWAGPPTNDYECMVTAVWFEARGEPEIGRRWVFEVVRNRATLNYRGQSTFCDVIYDRKQFSFANQDNSITPKPVTKAEVKLLEEIRKEVFQWMFVDPPIDISCGATHYLRYDIAWKVQWSRQALVGNSDEGLVPLATIGDHQFFGPVKDCLWR